MRNRTEEALLEACQVALMNLEMNTPSYEFRLTKLKLERAIEAAGGHKWAGSLMDQIKAVIDECPTVKSKITEHV